MKNNMPEDDKVFEELPKGQQLFGFMLQEKFDGRYVLKDGAYKIIVALVVGFAGLILTSVVVLGVNWALHIKP